MRTNFDSDFFIRRNIDKFALYSGLNILECTGILAWLWESTQRSELVQIPLKDFAEHSKMDFVYDNMDIVNKVIMAGVKSGFLAIEDNQIVIVGNEKRIKERSNYRNKQAENGRKGGQSNKKKGNEDNEANESESKRIEANESESKPNKPSNSNSNSNSNSGSNSDSEYLTTVDIRNVEDKCNVEEKRNVCVVAEKIPATTDIKKIPQKWISKISEFDNRVAVEWMKHARECSTSKIKYDISSFELAICKMRHEHGLADGEIVHVLKFVSTDDFWKGKALSPVSLLKPSKSDPGITKLEQVIRSIKHRPLSSNEKAIRNISKITEHSTHPKYDVTPTARDLIAGITDYNTKPV